ncbi:MAG: hypothetical protein V4736_09345 [Bdellovibrionota bacterium]
MKSQILIAIIFLGIASGCNSNPNGKLPGTVVKSEPKAQGTGTSGNGGSPVDHSEVDKDLAYRFVLENCDTLPRKAVSKVQLCKNLQLDWANNFCPEESRKKKFEELCSGMEWNPFEVKDQEMKKTSVPHIWCTVSDGDITEQEIQSKKRYINTQYSTDLKTIIPHEKFYALVEQAFVGGKVKVKIDLMNDQGVIATTVKSWPRFPDYVMVESPSKDARAVCYPSIH